MPYVPAMDFDYVKINDSSRYLRVGTHGRSIYETNLADLITNTEEHYDLNNVSLKSKLKVYPNPVNQKATIEFNLQQPGFVSLTIHNTLGQEIANLISEQLSAGTHKIEWKANVLNEGIYVLRLETNDGIHTTKMIKLD